MLSHVSDDNQARPCHAWCDKHPNGGSMQNGMAIVTGAARGLGREISLALAAAGMAVTAAHINAEAAEAIAEATAAAIAERGGKAIGLRLDVRDAAAIETIFAAAEHALGSATALV